MCVLWGKGMIEFKVGDKVEVINSKSMFRDKFGVITSIEPDEYMPIKVKLDKAFDAPPFGSIEETYFNKIELRLINETTTPE